MDKQALGRFCAEHDIAYELDAPLSARCSFRIGGAADIAVEPASEQQIAAVLRAARAGGMPVAVIGRGSNLLFSDEGFRGAVLVLGKRFAAVRETGENTLFCESGLPLKRLCEAALERSLTGLEWAYGIPGSLGGAVYMNAGAYGGEMADVLLYTRHLEPDGGFGELRGEAMGLSYRHSAYSGSGRIITGAALELRPGRREEIKAAMDDFMRRRREKQPLDYPSAGSTFRRPQGSYASALIDRCGLKGLRVGGAMVSEKHAGFVVNAGGATAEDVRALIERIQSEVKAQTGFDLECEVRIIGSESAE